MSLRRIELMLAGDYTALKERYGDVLGVIGDLCRSMIIPAPEHRFIIGDFNMVEPRVLASWPATRTSLRVSANTIVG